MTHKKYNFVGIPTRALEKELERRASLAYMRRVNAEYKARDKQPAIIHLKPLIDDEYRITR